MKRRISWLHLCLVLLFMPLFVVGSSVGFCQCHGSFFAGACSCHSTADNAQPNTSASKSSSGCSCCVELTQENSSQENQIWFLTQQEDHKHQCEHEAWEFKLGLFAGIQVPQCAYVESKPYLLEAPVIVMLPQVAHPRAHAPPRAREIAAIRPMLI